TATNRAGMVTVSSTNFFTVFNIDTSLASMLIGPNPYAVSELGTDRFKVYKVTRNSKVYIYSVNGRLIRTLENLQIEAGTGYFKWDLTDADGAQVSSGIYLIEVIDKTLGAQVNSKITVIH
ncbi:MAG TPA: FlgD immunoglobulin-like domain containing protein, partial [Spirochaetota bacterium]|nr:FlgD immunoglobulin-like domain containing protein [Spirochaetota bacterium]